jgi:hypothetical protein
MTHSITIYDHEKSFFANYDDTFALASFPHVEVQAEDGDNLRDVIDEALRSMPTMGESLPTVHAVMLAHPDPAIDPATPIEWAGAHAYWGVAEDGRLLVEGWGLSKMTVGEFRRGAESGYVDGSWDHIVVVHPEGLGGPGDLLSPLIEFLQNVGVELATGAAVTQIGKVKDAAQRLTKDHRARRVVESWHEQGIEGPWTLDAWIGVKSAWDANEVAKRLRLTLAEAESLLHAMGYEYAERLGRWTVGTSKKAIKQRRRWDKNAQREWQRPRHR